MSLLYARVHMPILSWLLCLLSPSTYWVSELVIGVRNNSYGMHLIIRTIVNLFYLNRDKVCFEQ